jgi:hypothetical protein
VNRDGIGKITCDIDPQDVGISPPVISLSGHLIVDRVETRGADF